MQASLGRATLFEENLRKCSSDRQLDAFKPSFFQTYVMAAVSNTQLVFDHVKEHAKDTFRPAAGALNHPYLVPVSVSPHSNSYSSNRPCVCSPGFINSSGTGIRWFVILLWLKALRPRHNYHICSLPGSPWCHLEVPSISKGLCSIFLLVWT